MLEFWSSIEIVARQVIQLFILMGAGVLCGKIKWLDDGGAKQITAILTKLITFCVIVESFISVEFSMEKIEYMAVATGTCFLCTAIGGLAATLCFHNKKLAGRSVLQFGTVFSNCGFVSLPLVSALLGTEGVFVVSVFVAVFHGLCWTYGVSIYHQSKRSNILKKLIVNPGVISVLVGLPLFFLRIPCPSIITEPMHMLSNLNTPLAMLVTGYYLSKMTLKVQKGDGRILLASFLRLLVVPMTVMGILYALGLRGFLLIACMVPVCAPSASNTSLFAVMFGEDEIYASRMISICTFCSVLTMPLILALAQMT